MDESTMYEQTQTPLHRRIAENLGNQVSTGSLKPGQRLPSERQIARQFNASRATVRTALQHLEQAGLISRRERRSAVVTIRRDFAPHLRIACTQPRLTSLFSRLSDMQVLPPRCQLQTFDLHATGSITQLLTQPTVGVDLLICDMEFVRCFPSTHQGRRQFPHWLIDEQQLCSAARDATVETDEALVVPLMVWPTVLYYNSQLLRQAQANLPNSASRWTELADVAQKLTANGRHGLQFRPTLQHLAAIIAGHGSRMFDENGKLAAHSAEFDSAVRFIYDLLHQRRCSPLLAKADQINLFAQRRCAMAMDGFDLFKTYRDQLGSDLGLSALPRSEGIPPTLAGFAAIAIGDQKNLQPVRDLLRNLLMSNAQRMLTEMSAGLPVRNDLLSLEVLESLGVPSESGQVLLGELNRCAAQNLAVSSELKSQVENLFLELWLRLDNADSLCARFKQLA